MRQKSNLRDSLSTENNAAADEMLFRLYMQAKMQFGDAIQAFWFYDGNLCPACNLRSIGAIKYKGHDALSLNAFIYRARRVLIGYFLCENCARRILRDAQNNPHTQTSVHAEIERNLVAAYHKHLKTLKVC
jgi:hypothetical protein